MFLYYKYVQLRAKHGQLFRYVLLFKVLRGVFFLIVIRILLHTNIIKGVASAKYFPFAFSCFVFCWFCWCSLVSYVLVLGGCFGFYSGFLRKVSSALDEFFTLSRPFLVLKNIMGVFLGMLYRPC